jgi:hypothetical protein
MILTRIPYPMQYYEWQDYAEHLHRVEGLRRLERFGVTKGCNSEDYHARVVEGKLLQLTPDDPAHYPEFIRPHEWSLPFYQLVLLYLTHVIPWQINANRRLSQMNRYRTLGMPAPTIYPLVTRHNEFRLIYDSEDPKAALRLFIEGKGPAFAAMEAYICMYRQAVADCSRKVLHHNHYFIADHYRNEPLYQLERDDQRHILHIRYIGQEPALRNCYTSFFETRDALWREIVRHDPLRVLFKQTPIHDYELRSWNIMQDKYDMEPEEFQLEKYEEDPVPVFYHGDFANEAWYDFRGYFDEKGVPHLRDAPKPETVSPAFSPTDYDGPSPFIPFTDPDTTSSRPYGFPLYVNDPRFTTSSRLYLAKLPKESKRAGSTDGDDDDTEMSTASPTYSKGADGPPRLSPSTNTISEPKASRPSFWIEEASETNTSDSGVYHIYPFGYVPPKDGLLSPPPAELYIPKATTSSLSKPDETASFRPEVVHAHDNHVRDPRRPLAPIPLPTHDHTLLHFPKYPSVDDTSMSAPEGNTKTGPPRGRRHRRRADSMTATQESAAVAIQANSVRTSLPLFIPGKRF